MGDMADDEFWAEQIAEGALSNKDLRAEMAAIAHGATDTSFGSTRFHGAAWNTSPYDMIENAVDALLAAGFRRVAEDQGAKHMAALPPNGEYLIQQSNGVVSLFHQYTGTEYVSFDPSDADETARAQGAIHKLTFLTDEQRSMAHFWSGYFYAHSRVD